MSDMTPLTAGSAVDQNSKAFAIQLMRDLVVPTFVLDASGRVLIWNNALVKLTGLQSDDVIGTKNHWRGFYRQERPCLADLVLDGDFNAKGLYEEMLSSSRREMRMSAENWCQFPRSRNRRYLAIDAGPIFSECGKLLAVVETLRDITDQKKAEDELLKLANIDGLTGIANRRAFDQSIEDLWQEAVRHESPMGLLLIDIDHFKTYNDTLGHQAGDDCLRQFGKMLASVVVSPDDIAARYGGEEFAILLPDTGADGVKAVAKRIQHAIAKAKIDHPASPTCSQITVSIGAAVSAAADKTPDDLIARADAALFKAKDAGRHRLQMA
jgi:diguanylate cyclase (GGDEF)-like protein